jgi:hypothetical protein
MALVIGDRTVRRQTCERCGRRYEHVTGFVYDDADAHSIYYAACHGRPEHDTWIDVVLGTWGDDDDEDHVTSRVTCEARAGRRSMGRWLWRGKPISSVVS